MLLRQNFDPIATTSRKRHVALTFWVVAYGRFDFSVSRSTHNKQLLDEVEHDIMNDQNRGLCYLPKPKAESDNTDTRF